MASLVPMTVVLEPSSSRMLATTALPGNKFVSFKVMVRTEIFLAGIETRTELVSDLVTREVVWKPWMMVVLS